MESRALHCCAMCTLAAKYLPFLPRAVYDHPCQKQLVSYNGGNAMQAIPVKSNMVVTVEIALGWHAKVFLRLGRLEKRHWMIKSLENSENYWI